MSPRFCQSYVAVAALGTLATWARPSSAADQTVQIPCDALLDGRSVSTFTGGAVVTWTAGQGVDGDGNGDGYVTTAVEAELVKQGKTVGGMAGKALPDDGLFAADARHPAIQLHFSNAADKASPQTHQIYIAKGSQSLSIPVTPATYSKLFLILTASEGAAALTVTLNYEGGAMPQVSKLMLPDYGIGGAKPGDPVFFNLIEGMRKWTPTNQEGDGPSHTITGIELAPSATDKLTSVQIDKTNGSHVVFWGATGIATSPVDVGGMGGSGGAGMGGAGGVGVGGLGGAGGVSTGGAAGAGGAPTTMAGAGGAGPGSAGAPVTVGGSGGAATSPNSAANSGDSGGCGVAHARPAGAALWLAVVAALGLVRRRAVRRSR